MGTWLVLATPTWSFDQPWLTLGLTFFGIAFLVGVAHQSQAALGAERAVGRGDHEAAAKHLRRWSWGSRVILVLLLAATWTMVFKPGQ